MKQSTSFAQVANNLLTVLQGYTKGIQFVAVLTMLLIVGIGQVWGAEVFKETFKNSTGTAGFSGNAGNGTFVADNTGWTTQNPYGAGGAAKFGTSKKIGEAETPSINCGIGVTSATLTFKSGAWSGDATTLKLSYTNCSGAATVTLKDAKWSEYTVELTNITGNIKIKFTGNATSDARFFLDDVVVSTTDAPTTYKVTYNANGATSGTAPTDATSYTSGTTVTVKSNSGNLAKTGYTFGGWNTKDDGTGTNYTAGSGTFTITDNTTLYAKWNTATKYTVTLDAGSGTCAASVTEASAGAGVTLPTPTLDGCDEWSFAGWKTTSAVTTETTTEPTLIPAGAYSPTSDITLYAVYKRTEETEGNGGTENVSRSYTFSNYTAGTQYAENEEHILDDVLTLTTTQCHFTSDLRIYSSNDHNGYVVSNKLPGRIISIGFNAGNNVDAIDVYGSTNGTAWTKVGQVSVTSTSYKDYTLSFGENNYTYFKLDVARANQVRLKSITITWESTSAGGTITTTYYHSTPDCGTPTPTPTLNVDPATLTFENTTTNTSTQKTFTLTGSNLTANASLQLSGINPGMFSLSSNSVTQSAGSINQTITVTYTPTATGSHNATLTISSTGAESKTVTLSGTGVAPAPTYTVTFNAGSGTCDDESLTETSGGAGVTLPTANPPAACATDGWEFAGWWTEEVSSTNTSPGTLMKAGDTYNPNSDITLYAVYSTQETGDAFTEYAKVTTAPDDWSGKYLLSTGTYTATGSFDSNGTSGHLLRTTYTPGTEEKAEWEFTLAKVGNKGYSILFPDGSWYLGHYDGTDFGRSIDDPIDSDIAAYLWTPSTNGITNVFATSRKIADNGSTDFRPYSSPSSGVVYLYKRIGGGTKTIYNSNPSCEVCENNLTINKGAETNGTFTLSKSGEIETCDGDVVVTVSEISPAEHYSVSDVTATTPTSGGAPTVTNNGNGTWTVTYAQDSKGESTISVTFVEDAKASITLSELGVENTDNTTYYVGETYTLPTTSSQSCDGKELVGWSTVEVVETDTKPTENYYELGAEVTLAATQTFYAVFATADNGGVDNTDYSNVHTSNVTLDKTGGTNATDSKVKIGGIDYTAVKAGTGSAEGAVKITVPAGTTKLSFHMAGWNGEGGKTISLSGATADPSSFKTVADAGVSGNSTTYTLSGTIANYFYSTALSNINTETTLTFSNGGGDQRFVIWGVNASTGGGVSYTAYTTSCIPTYSITYDFAGGTGSHCSNTSVPQGDPYTICDEAPTKEGHTFLGWSDGINTYQPNNSFTPTSDITLTAQWQINTYTVIWSNNGAPNPVEYNHGVALVVPEAPASCDGVKEFVGWTADNTFTYHATTPPSDIFTEKTATVTADATYYAVFATPPGTGGGGGGSETTTTLDFTAQGYADATAISNLTVDGVTATFDKGSNSNAPKYYTNGTAIRAYGGNTITLSSTGTITSVTFTFSTGDDGNEITANNGDGEWNEPDWTGNTTNDIVFTIGGTSGHRRIKSIAVTYTSGGGSGSYSDYTTICQQIESIEVQNPQTEFYLTDNFTIGEGKVIATLSGGGTADVTALATFSGYNMEVVGTYTVTVTYMGATATYNINVKPLDNAWVLTWNVSGKTNTGLGPRYVNKGSAIGTLPTPVVPDACEGKTFMGWTESNIVPSDGVGIEYITPETVPNDNTTYYAVFATVNNFCTQKPIDQIASGSKVVIVAVASLTDDGGAGKAISSRATDDTHNLQGDDVAIYDQTINTPHSTCIWTITKSGEKYIFTQDGKYLNGIIDGNYSNLKYNNTSDSWRLPPAASGMAMTYNMNSTNASTEYVEWYNGKFTIHNEVNKNGDFDMQFYVTANANGEADITDYTTGCEEYTITYYGFRGGYSTSTSSDGIIVLPVNSLHTVPNCGDVVTDHTNLGREFLNVWMTQPHGGHTFKPGDTFILTQDTTLYAQWKMETTNDVTTLPTDIEDLAGTDVYVYGGKTLNIQPGTTTINSLTLKGGLQSDGSYKMPIVWVPEGATLVRNSNKIYLDLKVNAKNYYPFAVPFATKNDQYIDYLDPVLNAHSTYDKHFVIKTYNGALRATNGEDRANNWVKVLRHATDKPSYLQPGVGYIITALTYPDKDTATIRIPMTVPNTWFENGEQAVVGTTVRNTIAVTAHDGDAANEHLRHAGWNFVASPYLTNFAGGNVENNGGLEYINGELTVNGGWVYGGDEVPYVTIPAYDFSYYTQHKLSDVKLSPEWSFFVQIGTSGTMNFSTDGRQEIPASIAARHDAAQSFKMDVDITLSDKHHSDQMGLIICDRFTSAYEIGYDLEKMFGSAYNLTVYTLMEDNTPLAYHALAIHSNMQVIPVGYRVPEQGDYTFALNQSTSSIDLLNEQYEQLILVDYETGALTNLLNSSYTFTSPRTQSNSRFAIYAVMRQDIPTDLPNIDDGDTSTRKILHNGHLYILRDGKVYNGNGQIVK